MHVLFLSFSSLSFASLIVSFPCSLSFTYTLGSSLSDLHIKGGSTATVMLICENTLTWGYVGDSKLVVGQGTERAPSPLSLSLSSFFFSPSFSASLSITISPLIFSLFFSSLSLFSFLSSLCPLRPLRFAPFLLRLLTLLCLAGKAVALTEDHRPNLPEEQKRIEANGGCVRILDGIARVQGVLAVSRSIGKLFFFFC